MTCCSHCVLSSVSELSAGAATAIHDYSTVNEQQLEALEAEIERVQYVLGRFTLARNKLKAALCTRENLLSPIFTLPFEILQHILVIAEQTELPNMRLHLRPRYILSLVCTTWRNLTLCSPLLWANLEISRASCGANVPHNLLLDVLTRHLRYSGRSKLTLRFAPDIYYSPDLYVSARTTGMDTLLREAGRWMDVELHNISGLELHQLRNTQASFPSLVRLEMSQIASVCGREGGLDLTWRCPALRHLNLPYVPDPTDLPIPWAQIESLAADTGARTILRLLKLVPRAVHLKLKSFDLFDELIPNTATERIDCPKLVALEIRQTTSSPESILSRIRAEAVQELVLVDSSNGIGQIICGFIRASNCSLTSLNLSAPMALEHLLETLLLTPALRRLAFHNVQAPSPESASAFFNAMTLDHSPNTVPLVPALTFLELRENINCDAETVVAMIRSRSARALRRVVLKVHTPYGHVFGKALAFAELREDGFDIDIAEVLWG
ncbi:F-box domain-containing protein [Mycena kentingensis (nom. inval.)]|nr:F-box domain-containing protein [Mycena kentingensis (nom. inval.)]